MSVVSTPTDDDNFSKIELEAMVRAVRQVRDEVAEKKLQLQERELSHGDGHVREAILLCENQAYLLTNCIAKLWRQIYPVLPRGGAPPKKA